MTEAMTRTTDAVRANRAMMERDQASAALGLVVERDDPGHAVVSMRVRDDMTNGFRITHGGFVFALADTAFAIACNEDDRVTVAAGADISFLKSTVSGQTLTATASAALAPAAPASMT
ncbi:hotdog fold thioesterase [Microbacterium sp. ZOR0019]|uniref:hotdog fold thioesterase n=1 Tax=Microbacterium sp. ZOR0019 TaxID=1339233 RepID=UPI000A974473